jgi:hypothetical protein
MMGGNHVQSSQCSRRFQNCCFLGETAVFKATALSDERRFGVLQIARGNAASGSPQKADDLLQRASRQPRARFGHSAGVGPGLTRP